MKYRDRLPQLDHHTLLTDSGLETTMVFLEGVVLPEFAAIDLMRTPEGRARLEAYFRDHLAVAREHGAGFLLESPTWRSNPDWALPLGATQEEFDRLNRESIEMLLRLRREFETDAPIVVSGCIGPRSDGYAPTTIMTAAEAEAYHRRQVAVFEESGVDCVSAITMCYPEEAIGIARAARQAKVPSVISFTVETDGTLITGQTIAEAIAAVDEATDAAPAYYMINCAHPSHFESALDGSEWVHRVGGIRANASKCSHAELDAMEELDWGDPDELGEEYGRLASLLPRLSVIGGCCGTDLRHIRAIASHNLATPLSARGA